MLKYRSSFSWPDLQDSQSVPTPQRALPCQAPKPVGLLEAGALDAAVGAVRSAQGGETARGAPGLVGCVLLIGWLSFGEAGESCYVI